MDLVERERELDALTALLDGLAAGRSRAALIEGPAGIGKSRLLAATREAAAERGILSLGARGSELEREFPFGVVRQMIEPALMARPNRTELFEGAAEMASAVFAPPGAESLGGDASFAVLHGLYWLTLDLVGDKPLLLTIDDLHWCDRHKGNYIYAELSQDELFDPQFQKWISIANGSATESGSDSWSKTDVHWEVSFTRLKGKS